MKRALTAFLAATIMLLPLAGCTFHNNDEGKLKIVATIFPEDDWIMNVVGEDNAGTDVKLLINNGVDVHSYQPTAEDIMLIQTCDVFVYVGGESDSWVTDVLENRINDDMTVINLMEVLSDNVKEEETVEGMESEDEEEEESFDEHVWLSLRNAELCVLAIEDALKEKDPQNGDIYEANAAAYVEELDSLDAEYEEVISGAPSDTLLFADRFPFRYLTEDYGLNYYAAFAGCSAETNASFDTITFLAGKVDELDLPAILIIDGSDGSVASTVASCCSRSDIPVLTLDSMQSVTSSDIENGADYLTIMRGNLDVLSEALSA